MIEWFRELGAVWQALIAGGFTWGVTLAGASLVFFARAIHRKLLDAMLGFAGGVMIAASFWSLLAPAISVAEKRAASDGGLLPAWGVVAIGFLLGAGLLIVLDHALPHLHLFKEIAEAEGPRSAWKRSTLLVLAITLHNIPEGLAVGVAFGGVAGGLTDETGLSAAVALAIGIGVQNFPEGVAVAFPLRGSGIGRFKSFMYGQASAAVEPVAAVLGAAAVGLAQPLLPYALAFAAGAMIYVVVEELIPESHQAGNVDLATTSLIVGFTGMMILDVGLG